MINFYISYFYQIRNMKPNMLPVSTAMWDPKWFHNNKKENYRYMDKNGVINGVRLNTLCMDMYRWEKLVQEENSCETCDGDINNCHYMKAYAECIRQKNPDFNKFITFCDGYLQFLNERFNLNLDTMIFIVHESPVRRCGERPVIIEWFEENGIELKEYNK